MKWKESALQIEVHLRKSTGAPVFRQGRSGKEEDKAADRTIDAFEKTFAEFGMPVRISGLGIDATDEVCRMLAEKASLKGKKTLGNFRILKTEDMYNIFKAAR